MLAKGWVLGLACAHGVGRTGAESKAPGVGDTIAVVVGEAWEGKEGTSGFYFGVTSEPRARRAGAGRSTPGPTANVRCGRPGRDRCTGRRAGSSPLRRSRLRAARVARTCRRVEDEACVRIRATRRSVGRAPRSPPAARRSRSECSPLRRSDRRPASHADPPRVHRERSAGVFSPHDLRHRRISLLHRQGITWAEIAERVGHRSKALTADVYSHVLVDPREIDRAALL